MIWGKPDESECHRMTLITDQELSSLRLNTFPFRWQHQGGPLNTGISVLNFLFSWCQWFPNYVLQSRGISEHKHWGLENPISGLILHLSLYPHYLYCGLTPPRGEVYFPTLVLGWPCGLALTKRTRWKWRGALPKHNPFLSTLCSLWKLCLLEKKWVHGGESSCPSQGSPIVAYRQRTPKYQEPSQDQLSKNIHIKYANPSLDQQTHPAFIKQKNGKQF